LLRNKNTFLFHFLKSNSSFFTKIQNNIQLCARIVSFFVLKNTNKIEQEKK